jgi:predicted DNA-binding WGR domain protein
MKRELFCQDDKSNKFWTVEVKGKVLVTSYGRIGASPRETRKVLASPAAAAREADNLVASKHKGGYVEGAVTTAPAYDKPAWTTMKMSEAVFWRIIKLFNWHKTGDDDAVLKPAVAALSQMTIKDIQRFDDLLAKKLFALDTEAHARNTGDDAYQGDAEFFSVDTFLYARCCIVANGADFFDKVLADPTAMPKDMEFEAILTLASEAYAKKTGNKYDYSAPTDYETFANKAKWSAKSNVRRALRRR